MDQTSGNAAFQLPQPESARSALGRGGAAAPVGPGFFWFFFCAQIGSPNRPGWSGSTPVRRRRHPALCRWIGGGTRRCVGGLALLHRKTSIECFVSYRGVLGTYFTVLFISIGAFLTNRPGCEISN
jgi:hypothetical protein